MNILLIFIAVMIILCGAMACAQDDSIPKNIESDSSLLPEAKADSINDGYYFGGDYPNPF